MLNVLPTLDLKLSEADSTVVSALANVRPLLLILEQCSRLTTVQASSHIKKSGCRTPV